jgi:hypothetical protein
MRMASYSMAGAYMLTFVINFAVPAMSPRLYLHDEYSADLEGLLVAKALNEALKKGAGGDPRHPMSFGAFPSGHVGLTWLPACIAWRLGFTAVCHAMPCGGWAPGMTQCHVTVQYGRVVVAGAVAMTGAVLYLRYHYLSDALAAIAVLVPAGLYAGRMLPHQMHEDAVYLKYDPARTDIDTDNEPP